MNIEIKRQIHKRQRLHNTGKHVLRDQLAHHIVGLIAVRNAAYYREKYASSIIDMWAHANNLRKPPTTLLPDPEYGERLNEQFSDTVWEGIVKSDLSNFILRNAQLLIVP